ncbi:hypothetical protein [Brevibacillus sp. 179-C9.3 HS]|uniref:hypothetical protein n=1 Tax=unclassified Brevibacillus TaxID=2684853 RepID=UPI0039A34FE6
MWFDIFVYFMMGLFLVMVIFLFYMKKRMDANEPIFGWQRKQYLKEQGKNQENDQNKVKRNKVRIEIGTETLEDMLGIKDIRYGVFEKTKNEYCLIVATDSVNFDLLNDGARQSIILGYQSLFRVIRFPVQILGQAVRQDLRKEEQRFEKNLEKCNKQTQEYNREVIKEIKEKSEKEFRISRRVYYVISYSYQPSAMGQLSVEAREQRILQELYMRAATVVRMLKRAKIEAEILESLRAMEVIKRALNRDRIVAVPIESLVEEGKEKFSPYVTADVTTLPGWEDLVYKELMEEYSDGGLPEQIQENEAS